MAQLQARWHRATDELPEAQWQALAPDNPFYLWRWLHHLEASGSMTPRHGWQCSHLSLWRGDRLIAVAPLYLKGHSYGEFIFDQSFAQLAGQLGLRYYPKLVGMSPVSPVEGYRFLIAADEDAQGITLLLIDQIRAFCRDHQILSCNFLYVDPEWRALAEAAGCATWLNQQSLWTNPGHHDFDGYLASFNANQRRNIRRERRSIAQQGIVVTPVVGEEIPPALLARMHHFYGHHCRRWGPWGSKYLTGDFFTALASDLREHVVLFSAHTGDPHRPVAMSMCVFHHDHLWGRYWGSDVEIDHLHFEVCYYSPIEWAIARGMRWFDPGAGGGHKRRRGFTAQPRVSLHLWQDAEFDTILRRWLPEANRQVCLEIEAVNAELPFRSSYDPPYVSPLLH
jgi:predicted N-acyltransferase